MSFLADKLAIAHHFNKTKITSDTVTDDKFYLSYYGNLRPEVKDSVRV